VPCSNLNACPICALRLLVFVIAELLPNLVTIHLAIVVHQIAPQVAQYPRLTHLFPSQHREPDRSCIAAALVEIDGVA